MTWNEAARILNKHGTVTRFLWSGVTPERPTLVRANTARIFKTPNGYASITRTGNGPVIEPWSPTSADLAATDWVSTQV